MVNEVNEIKDPKLVYETLNKLVGQFAIHLKQGQYVRAYTQSFPNAEIDDNGKDHVFEDVENITLEYSDGINAVDSYLAMLKPQSKKLGISSLSARRLAGVIHIKGTEDWLVQTYKLLDDIHTAKKDFQESLVSLTATRYARQQLLRTFAPELLPLTAYRQFPYIRHDEPIERVYFSWVTQGRTYEELDLDGTLNRIRLRNHRKVELGCQLSESELNDIDIAALGNKEAFTLVRPSKVYATMQTVDLNQKISQPIKLALPMLVLQPLPLKHYPVLPDFNLDNEKIKKLAKRTKLIPVIQEYGLFCKP